MVFTLKNAAHIATIALADCIMDAANHPNANNLGSEFILSM